MADIFLSYSHDDGRRVGQLVKAFEDLGWSVWWDRSIEAGTRWDERIDRELRAAKCTVVAWSASSVHSRFVREEAALALAHEKLVPASLDGTAPPRAFAAIEVADLSRWLGSTEDANLINLEAGIRAVLAQQGALSPVAVDRLSKNRTGLKVWGITLGGKFFGFASGVIAKPLGAGLLAAGVGVAGLLGTGHLRSWRSSSGAEAPGLVQAVQAPGHTMPGGAGDVRLSHPLPGHGEFVSVGFGMRVHPLLGTTRLHTGIDWSAQAGTPVAAAADGVVEARAYVGEFGNRIVVQHSADIATSYSHLARFADGLAAGARVARGDVIGFVGSTGLAAGPHLHFEVLAGGRPVDPMALSIWESGQVPASP